jgi:5-methyltetrahydropteroyltriglutamate--homocysteine methyltransferase
MGANRELKRALESNWAGKTAETELLAVARRLRAEHWRLQQAAGIDWIPSNDFSLYDQMLDACRLVGAIPERFRALGTGLEAYFAMARGEPNRSMRAMEMTKWFDTNYHYLVPELEKGQEFHLASTKPFDEFAEALALGIRTVPVLIGPLTFLQLAKTGGAKFNRFGLMARLVPVYVEVLRRLREGARMNGSSWTNPRSPSICAAALAAARDAYAALRTAAPGLHILLATYFGGLGDNLSAVCRLPVDALHVNAVRAPAELDRWLTELPPTMALSLGVVDGRNVWKNDYDTSLDLLRRAQAALGSERLLVSPSCSLLHVPHAWTGKSA